MDRRVVGKPDTCSGRDGVTWDLFCGPESKEKTLDPLYWTILGWNLLTTLLVYFTKYFCVVSPTDPCVRPLQSFSTDRRTDSEVPRARDPFLWWESRHRDGVRRYTGTGQ